jgi:predicted metalloprotease with PDZ domain
VENWIFEPCFRTAKLELSNSKSYQRLLSANLQKCLLLSLWAIPAWAQQATNYTISFPNMVHHEAEVRAEFSGVSAPALEVFMSRSSPGRYALHEFAKNVYNVRASGHEGHPLAVTRLTPYSWSVAVASESTVVFEYTLFGDRTDGTYDGIDPTHAHLNMPATFVWARGYENKPSYFQFTIPENSQWKIATQLLPQADGRWSAPDLEWMMDSPVEISNYMLPEWKVENATFRMALHFPGTAEEANKYAQMCRAVVLEEEGVFGALPKYDGGTYTFLMDYLPYASGDGMEHRDSTVITSQGDLKNAARILSETASHEFFHSWNVKRIRPRTLEPFDFEGANMSGELWFAEGFTNYYGPLVLQRAGLSTLDQFVSGMGQALNAVLTWPGRKIHSAVEMSQLAPFVDAAKSIDPNNFRNTFISYYTYGQALALGIDLTLREKFPGKSLDDWMRRVWREHPDIQKPYTLADLQSALAEITGKEEFAKEIFERHIIGKEPMDYEKLLTPAGLLLRLARPRQAWWGASELKVTDGGAEITTETLRGTPLYQAGLEKGDYILQFNGKAIKAGTDMDALVGKRKPGDRVQLKVRTRAGEKQLEVTLEENPQLELVIFEQAGRAVTPEITAFRKSWLSSKALHPLPQMESSQ